MRRSAGTCFAPTVDYFVGVRAEPETLTRTASALEDLGYDGLTRGDHRSTVDSGHLWAGLGALAGATRKATLVSAFANNLFRHPAEFVQASLAIHKLSGGRFEAGLGAGWAREELERVGTALPDPRERVDRLREACEIARALLRGEEVDFEGRYYKVQFPAGDIGDAPPLVAALGGPRSGRLVAPLVDRVEVMFGAAVAGGAVDFGAGGGLTEEALRQRIDVVRDAAPDVAVGVGVFVAAGDGDEVARLRGLAGDGLQSRLVGDPARVADTLASLADLGIDRVGLTPMTGTTAEVLAPHLRR